MLNALQSVVALMVITRVCGIEAAGIYSISYAMGNLFLYLGNYGVRNYQVSDLQERYSFSDYLYHRMFTTILMLAAAALYTAINFCLGSYSLYKAGCVMAMGVLKAAECLSEVFEGRYQQRGRLDCSGKLQSFRLLFSIGGMMIVLVVTGDLLTALWCAVLFSLLASVVLVAHFRSVASYQRKMLSTDRISGLMRECFPVCASNFLTVFVINEPKYVMDAMMDETSQACYGFISMPVFVIQLMTMFIYQPMLVRMTLSYVNDDRKAFLCSFRRVTLALLVISVPVILAAWFLGIPVLSVMYATNLSAYKEAFMILMLGGIFLAFNGFCTVVLTVMRLQSRGLAVYLIGSVISMLVTTYMTGSLGIYGACLSFLIVMIAITVMMAVTISAYCTDENFSRRNGK